MTEQASHVKRHHYPTAADVGHAAKISLM